MNKLSRSISCSPYQNGDHIQLQSSQFSQLELPYTNIRSSRFCFGRILFLREEVRQIGSKHKDIIYAQGLATLENLCLGHALKRVLESVEISGLVSGTRNYCTSMFCVTRHIALITFVCSIF